MVLVSVRNAVLRNVSAGFGKVEVSALDADDGDFGRWTGAGVAGLGHGGGVVRDVFMGAKLSEEDGGI